MQIILDGVLTPCQLCKRGLNEPLSKFHDCRSARLAFMSEDENERVNQVLQGYG